jgi:hypothetical protein
MPNTTFDKSASGHPIRPTNERTTIYRQNPGSLNSPNSPGGEVKRSTVVERGNDLIKR